MILRRAVSLLVVLGALAAASAADVNRIVLRVNERIATLFEFEQRRASRVREIQRADLPPERKQRMLAEVSEQMMREIYEELLVLSRADQLDLRASPEEIEAAVDRARGSFRLQSEEEFRAALAAAGMTLEDLRGQMERNLLIRKVMGREVHSRIELEEEDLRRYYREHADEFTSPRRLEVREVVVPDAVDPDEARRLELAAEVRQAMLAGAAGEERLAELAESGEATARLELGWVERGDLGAALEREVWELEAGQVSEPIPARGGLHVVEVLRVEEATLRPFSEAQEEIEGLLRRRSFQEALGGFLEELERSSYVVSDPPPEAAGFLAAELPDAAELDPLGLGAESPASDGPAPAPEPDPAAEPPPAEPRG